jgi:hypothetical protein
MVLSTQCTDFLKCSSRNLRICLKAASLGKKFRLLKFLLVFLKILVLQKSKDSREVDGGRGILKRTSQKEETKEPIKLMKTKNVTIFVR